jgi:hypothetical protein
MPPAPSCDTISYGPSFVPEVRAIKCRALYSESGEGPGWIVPIRMGLVRVFVLCGMLCE